MNSTFADKGLSSESSGFSSSLVWMWELDHKEVWAAKNWCFWTVVLEKTPESLLDWMETKPVNPKENQSWVFIERTDAEAEAPILWPPDVKSWLIGKDPDAGKDLRQEKGMTEDEMVWWHHWLDGHEFEQALGFGDGQRRLVRYKPWDCYELDMTEWLNWMNNRNCCFVKFTVLHTWFWTFLFHNLCACSVTQSCLTLPPHRLQPIKFFCPWNFPNKNTRVGYHFLLQGISSTQASNPCLLHCQVESSSLSHLGSWFIILY